METPRVGVGIIIEKAGKVLLLKRKNVLGTGYWSTPGGHLDFGETPEQCAIRELEEETGLIIHQAKFIAITNDVYPESKKHYITIWMQGEYISGEPCINADYEMSEVGWYSWNHLPGPLFLPFEQLLKGHCYSNTLWTPSQ